MKKQALNNVGDTIVEVLIAIAIVSLVLAGAYTSTRQSANATRTAQEQGEALKIAESQVEQIKINQADTRLFTGGNFCFDVVQGLVFSDDPCVHNNGVIYSAKIWHVQNTYRYSVKVTWDGLSGIQNNVQLDYRTKDD